MDGDIGFVGGGNMATAIIGGLLARGSSTGIRVVDPAAVARDRLADRGVLVGEDPALLEPCSLIVLAIKPQVLPEVAGILPQVVGTEDLLVTILAGITTGRIEDLLPAGRRVVRAMPNTPLAIGQGMVGLSAGSAATAADLARARDLFADVAEILEVPEELIDAVTAVSGSGPAYLFYFAEALHRAARELGLTDEAAARLVGQTLEGSIAYLRDRPGFPAAELRRQVTSPGGTTAAALAVFEEAGLSDVILRALTAARDRAVELSRD